MRRSAVLAIIGGFATSERQQASEKQESQRYLQAETFACLYHRRSSFGYLLKAVSVSDQRCARPKHRFLRERRMRLVRLFAPQAAESLNS